MVAMNFTLPSARFLIPSDIKRTTIRRYNPRKIDQIERMGRLQLYWMQRTPECELLGERDLKRVTVVEEPILQFIMRQPPEFVYGEGFGFDREEMLLFFIDRYTLGQIQGGGQFYVTEWWPAQREVT